MLLPTQEVLYLENLQHFKLHLVLLVMDQGLPCHYYHLQKFGMKLFHLKAIHITGMWRPMVFIILLFRLLSFNLNDIILETSWEVPTEGYVSLMEQQLEELKNATADKNETSAEPIINKKKKKKKKKKESEGEFYENNEEEFQEDETASEATSATPYGQWETVQKPYANWIIYYFI